MSANAGTIIGIVMGVVGFFVTLYPPDPRSWAQVILAVIFVVLLIVALASILVPEYRKALLDDPETIMNETFSLASDVIHFTNGWRVTVPIVNEAFADQWLQEKFNREFKAQFVVTFGGRIHKLITRLRSRNCVLQQADEFYLRPNDPIAAMIAIQELANTGYSLGMGKHKS